MSKAFTPFIKAIGAGQRAGRYLTEEEAFIAMSMVLNNQVQAEQKGAFLMLLRVREESIDELTGFVRACRSFLPSYKQAFIEPSLTDIDIACYAGKRRQLPWFILAISLLQQNGFRLFVHGTTEPHSARLYIKDALRQLGLLGSLQAATTAQAIQKINTQGIAYMDLQDIHAPLDGIIQLRELFGLRSCANTLARLLNPLNATYSVQGVHHQGIDHKHVNIAAKLQDKQVLCFRGEGGEPEVNPAKITNLHFYSHSSGEPPTQIDMPASQSWQIKPKSLDASLLLKCWQGDNRNTPTNDYAFNTLISTLVPMLMMTKSLTMTNATTLAKRWWNDRNKAEFLSVDLKGTSASELMPQCQIGETTQRKR
jgi:anthranilate phosphoribosyltransferase